MQSAWILTRSWAGCGIFPFLGAACVWTAFFASGLEAADGGRQTSGGKLVVVENVVDRSPPQTAWTKAAMGDPVAWNDRIRTGELSRAAIELSTGGVLRMSELTSLRLQPPKAGNTADRAKIDFGKGVAYFFSRAEEEADIQTPTASLNIRGTEFVVEVGGNGTTTVTLLDGAVDLTNPRGSVSLASGEQGIVEPGRPPRKTAVLDASDRIQWFLYYPGILDPADFAGFAAGRFAKSREAYAAGDLLGALETLESPRDRHEHLFCAAVKLASGRTDEVAFHLAKSTPGPERDALERMISIVANPSGFAMPPDAPGPAAWLMVRSHALQARGDLAGSLRAARAAVALSPDFGMAWARVAELEFSFGRTKEAAAAVGKSLEHSPCNAQAVALQGFLELAQGRNAPARDRFTRAIALDPALANGWLGLGLAHFNKRERAEGLRLLTIAAAVEPNRAFLRSYLAKALAENNRDLRAANELELARSLDAGDPTPFLYQALLDQRGYRFNRAVDSLEHSISLNDNRGIYRSTFLLDRDRGVREANLAAIYQNAGATFPALESARRSVVADYTNPQAHLFLSNSINALRDPRRVSLRQETPWFNELLLANLLSPAGSALYAQNISQQEYADLFTPAPFGFSSRTRYRDDGEWLATGSARAIAPSTSVAFDYDIFTADGFRPNQDVERFTGYLQMKQALGPDDSVYLNLKFQQAEGGDLRQLHDATTYDPDYRFEQEQSPLVIAGYQRQWSPQHRTLLLGGLLTDDLTISDPGARSAAIAYDPANPSLTPPLGFLTDLDQHRETEIHFGEIQHIWSGERHTLLAGARFDSGHFETTNTFSNQAVSGVLPADPYVHRADPDYERRSVYLYQTYEILRDLHATAGIAWDEVESPVNTQLAPASDDSVRNSEWLPKAGLVWTPADEFTLRLAYARSLGGASFDESVRLEPAQVAGFTQAFRTIIDESAAGALPAPLFDIAGLAALYRFPTRTFLGAEAFQRDASGSRGLGVLDIDRNTVDFTGVSQLIEDLDYREWGAMVSVNQLVGENWGLGATYTFTDASLERSFAALGAAGINNLDSDVSSQLHDIETYLVWNHEDGWFARLGARWLSQANSGDADPLADDSWTQLDLSGGRRFFGNRAAIEVGVLNLTDNDYQHYPLVSLPDFPRERTFFVELRLDF